VPGQMTYAHFIDENPYPSGAKGAAFAARLLLSWKDAYEQIQWKPLTGDFIPHSQGWEEDSLPGEVAVIICRPMWSLSTDALPGALPGAPCVF